MSDKLILLGVTGGVAAFKAAAMSSQLAQQGLQLQVVMSASSQQFVGSATFAALSGRAVISDLFDPAFPLGAHIELARKAALFCVAPATASFLAKAAHGIADDLISTLYLSFTGPVLVAPAMNCEMWEKPSVQRNVAQLKSDGVHFVGPHAGWLSCRDQGVGRMAEPTEIAERVLQLLNGKSR